MVTKSTLVALGLGQFLSFLVTFTGFTTSLLAKKGIDAPGSQCFLHYLLLALVNGCILIYRWVTIQAKIHYYVMMALVDFSAKVLVITAYQHTSLTSGVLLDCWTIPWLLFLTGLFSKTKYGFQKLVGVAICVTGLITIVYSDVHPTDRSSGSVDPRRGDLAIIVGAILYSVNSVFEAFLVEKVDRVELMAFLGFYGSISCASVISKYERNELKSILSSPEAIFSLIGFSFAMSLFHSGIHFLIKMGGSTMLNLSLLTSNIWAVLIRVFVYHEKWIYFVAFVNVTLGIIVYSGYEDGSDAAAIGQTLASDEDADLGLSTPVSRQ